MRTRRHLPPRANATFITGLNLLAWLFICAPIQRLDLAEATPFSRADTAVGGKPVNYCSNGPNRYFCAESCTEYYYCNGDSMGELLSCPAGSQCVKLGPHRKYYDTDATIESYDVDDVTFACEDLSDIVNRSAQCWNDIAPGLCERKQGQDQTCTGGGYCRSKSPECVNGLNSDLRACKYDTQGEECECKQSSIAIPSDFDPTFTSNATIKSTEGRSCSIVNPGLRKQCDPPMDVIFVMDASISIVRGNVDPKGYAKARQFVKTFMSYFVVSPSETRIGFVPFSEDVTVVDNNGNQVCVNALAQGSLVTPIAQSSSSIISDSCDVASTSDTQYLDMVLASDASKAARSIDQKFLHQGTRMFLGMAIARRVLERSSDDDRDKIVILTTDGEDTFQTELLLQADYLKKMGVRVITIAAGEVVTRAASGNEDSLLQLATLRDASSRCVCTKTDGSPCTEHTCMGTATCQGDCFRANNYNELITDVVEKIVRENCEVVSKVRPGNICSSRSETVYAEGRGFGAKKPADGNIKFKIGDSVFDGTWISDSLTTLKLGTWQNQFGSKYQWDPRKNPLQRMELTVQVSNDGGTTWMRQDTSDPKGFTIVFTACERVDFCSPGSDGTCFDCHEGLNVITIKGQNMGMPPNGKDRNDKMVCRFGNVAVSADWVDDQTAKCIVPPMNCTIQSEFCDASRKPPDPMWKGPPASIDAPHHRIIVPFNFSLDGGLNWFPLNQTMRTFHYESCRPICSYENTMPPIPLILLLLSLLLCCLPPMALLIGDKAPLQLPELQNMPEPEPPPPLIFTTVPVTIVKKVKKITVTKTPAKKKKEVKKQEANKKRWNTVAAGQYLRGGKQIAVGWGKYGEAAHGEEMLSGEEDSSSEDEEIDWDLEGEKQFELAFDEVEEQITMPQAPEDVAMPEIQQLAGITIEVEEELTWKEKFNVCLKDWRWKWWVVLLLVLVLMSISTWMLVTEHNRLQDEINARTYGLSDPECERNPHVSDPGSPRPKVLWNVHN